MIAPLGKSLEHHPPAAGGCVHLGLKVIPEQFLLVLCSYASAVLRLKRIFSFPYN